ncbi:hypothetical protein X755_14390 [Mesorhizobium sp. LNJC405B00]|nr:hypothetical protein X755_14390 [Mesorhizobium sp. LNJC405B00]
MLLIAAMWSTFRPWHVDDYELGVLVGIRCKSSDTDTVVFRMQ